MPLTSFVFLFLFFISKLFAQHGTRTRDPVSGYTD